MASEADRAHMLRVAAGVMGRSTPVMVDTHRVNHSTASPTLINPATPRTVPTQTASTVGSESTLLSQAASAAVKKENVAQSPESLQAPTFAPPVPETSFTFRAPTPSSTNASPTVAGIEGSSDANNTTGQSLRGSAEQLAEARTFLQSATHSKTRPSRSRLISRSPSTGSASSIVSSPRPATASLAMSMRRPETLAAPADSASSNAWGAFAAKPQTATITAAAAAAAAAANASAQASSNANLTKSIGQACGDGSEPSTLASRISVAGSLVHRQMVDITNTLTDRASNLPVTRLYGKTVIENAPIDSRVPVKPTHTLPTAKARNGLGLNSATPSFANKIHQFSEGTANAVDRIAPESTATPQGTVKPAIDNEGPRGQGHKSSRQLTSEEKVSSLRANDTRNKDKGSMLSTAAKPVIKGAMSCTLGTKQDPIVIDDHASASSSASPSASPPASKISTSGSKDMMALIVNLQHELARLTTKVNTLAAENIDLTKAVQELSEAAERRKFLGTDDAKVPFLIDVSCPSGSTHGIQVTKELRIASLIRRVRVKSDLTAANSANPRVLVGGHQVGHGLTLGELDVKEGQTLHFTYDETADEKS